MTATPHLNCSNCAQPLRPLTLAGHYQREVEIDVCDRCCLIWFDEVESVRLAGAGVAGLVRHIHGVMSNGQHPQAASLARLQHCAVCGTGLVSVLNASRFGRTSQLECPHKHGYYQTYILYLAEKGFIRPIVWADIRDLAAAGRELFCASCGAPMEARPHDACPYCHSAVGMLDPARLASAIDVGRLADGPDLALLPQAVREQTRCAKCGGAVDSTRDAQCPHCQALIRRGDTEAAVRAGAAVEEARASRKRPSPEAIKARLKALTAGDALKEIVDSQPVSPWRSSKVRTAAWLVLLGALLWFYRGGRDDAGEEADAAGAPPAIAQLYAAPVLACAPDAASRNEVQIRRLFVAVNPVENGPRELRRVAALRSAYAQAAQARKEWAAGAPYPALLQRLGGGDASEIPVARGDSAPQLERAAFCLPLNAVSPVIPASDGFHVIQVVGVR